MMISRRELGDTERTESPDRQLATAGAAPAGPVSLDLRRQITPQPINRVNVKDSEEVIVGSKIINIKVDNRPTVKSHLWGLEFKSKTKRTRAIRCSCAVSGCVVLLVAIGFLVFMVASIPNIPQSRLDPEFTSLVKTTSRAERWAFSIIGVLVLVCIALILVITLRTNEMPEKEQHGWYVNRSEWQSDPTIDLSTVGYMHKPSPLVIINHSVTSACYNTNDCSALMRNMQSDYKYIRNWTDVPYNFAIGSDGRVYEGRGWSYNGAHSGPFNICSLGIGYLGDYRIETRATNVTEEMVKNMYQILDLGVELGYLRSDYVIVGHRDVLASLSPGDILYELMWEWPEYDLDRYAGMSCNEIWEMNEGDTK